MSSNIDVYQLRKQKHFKDDKEMYEFIKKSFPDVRAVPVKGSYFSFAFCLFAHVCYPLSLNALVSATGAFVRSGSSRVKISRLLNRGAIKTYNFLSSDKGATSAYYLTPVGSDNLFSSLPPEICVKNKIRRTGGSVPLHEHGIGLSLLQCMLREVPFSFNKEVCYSSALYKDKGSLCVDAVVFFKDRNENILYIEQDMGTEPPATLVKKLVSYEKYGLTQSSNRHLVISSHCVFNYPPCLSYNGAALSELRKDMEERGAIKVFDYYIANRNALSERMLLTVKALLVRTGVCDCYNTNHNPVDACEVTTEHFLNRNEGVQDFYIEDLEHYITTLAEGTNIYKNADYNRRQYDVAQGKLRNMADIIIRRISMGQFEMDEVRSLLGGFSCYVVPSVLLSNYFDKFFMEYEFRLRRSLSTYYSSIMDAPYQEYSDTCLYRGAVPVRFRNCFVLSDGSRVCVEHVGADLGGYVRGYLLRMMQIVESEENVHLVCIFDTEKDAMDYARVIDYYRKGRELDTGKIMISFMLSCDIGKENALQVPSRLGGGGLVRVKPLYEMNKSSSVDFSSGLEGLSISELSKLLR